MTQPRPFAWLTRASSRGPSVFVPVLLGAGAILSALAYVVERIAQATAVPALDHHLAHRLAAIAPPRGGLHGTSLAPPPDQPQRQRAAPHLHRCGRVAAIVVVTWLGVQALLDATQTRPDPADRPSRTTIEVIVAQRRADDGARQAAEAVWVGCRAQLGALPTDVQIVGGAVTAWRSSSSPGSVGSGCAA